MPTCRMGTQVGLRWGERAIRLILRCLPYVRIHIHNQSALDSILDVMLYAETLLKGTKIAQCQEDT